MLAIHGVTKRFGSLTAVDRLDLVVPAGTVHAFLGPNGAGKTTTLKMVCGLLRPDAGMITVAGHDVLAEPVAARAAIAYVPDEPHLYDRLTGREFLEFTARIWRLPADAVAERIAEVVARFALEEFLDRLADGYSHGQRQRVVLAAALLHRPRLLVVDEPLVGLDPKHIRVVLDLLREIADGGGAVLMSTHTLATVEQVCDHISVMDHGRLIAAGTVAQVRGDRDLESRFLELTNAKDRWFPA